MMFHTKLPFNERFFFFCCAEGAHVKSQAKNKNETLCQSQNGVAYRMKAGKHLFLPLLEWDGMGWDVF
jgi:hypothetical protein